MMRQENSAPREFSDAGPVPLQLTVLKAGDRFAGIGAMAVPLGVALQTGIGANELPTVLWVAMIGCAQAKEAGFLQPVCPMCAVQRIQHVEIALRLGEILVVARDRQNRRARHAKMAAHVVHRSQKLVLDVVSIAGVVDIAQMQQHVRLVFHHLVEQLPGVCAARPPIAVKSDLGVILEGMFHHAKIILTVPIPLPGAIVGVLVGRPTVIRRAVFAMALQQFLRLCKGKWVRAALRLQCSLMGRRVLRILGKVGIGPISQNLQYLVFGRRLQGGLAGLTGFDHLSRFGQDVLSQDGIMAVARLFERTEQTAAIRG
mmetsp:Transcript_23289/g.40264  ORF Transcript_23289/g.40264 Transcript_23289/m.40264 type:complete len:315 (-) Transcript_23289:62-1006(-)